MLVIQSAIALKKECSLDRNFDEIVKITYRGVHETRQANWPIHSCFAPLLEQTFDTPITYPKNTISTTTITTAATIAKPSKKFSTSS